MAFKNDATEQPNPHPDPTRGYKRKELHPIFANTPTPKTPKSSTGRGSTGTSSAGSTARATGSRSTAATHRLTTAKKTRAKPNPLGPGWYYDATQNELVYDPQVAQYEQAVASKSTSTGTARQSSGRQPTQKVTPGEYDAVGKTSTWRHAHRTPRRLYATPAHRTPY